MLLQVKCTSKDIFRVRPTMGFIAPGEVVPIKLMLKTKKVPPPKRHFFAFHHMSCKDEDSNPRVLCTESTKPEGIKHIPCEFLKTDGTPYNIYTVLKMIPSVDDVTNKQKFTTIFSK